MKVFIEPLIIARSEKVAASSTRLIQFRFGAGIGLDDCFSVLHINQKL